MLRLLGDIPLKITQKTDNEFIVTPERELDQNSLCTFVITTPEKKPLHGPFKHSENFQFWVRFRLTGQTMCL